MALWRRNPARRAESHHEVGFGPAAYARLAERVDAALRLAAERGRGVVAAVTVPLPPEIDPLAHVQAARKADELWSHFAQPAHEDYSLTSLGVQFENVARGRGRFAEMTALNGGTLEAALLDDLSDDPGAPRGSGVVWVGGFGFLDDSQAHDAWRELPSMRFVLPSVAIARRGGDDPQSRMTLALFVRDRAASELMGEAEDLVERLDLDSPVSGVFSSRAGEATVSSVAAPEHYERAVADAAAEIRSGNFEKIVLARAVTLRREHDIDPFNAVRGLADAFPECTTFALADSETAFVGATPELLIRREGRRASTMALAGSARRGSDSETDNLLGQQLLESDKNRREHDIVVKRIERVLGRRSAWIAAGESPELVKVKNIQHLATPIRAQLTEPRPVLELAGMLHPTPAVGGEPWSVVRDRIKQLEGFDRGWYTGGVGWTDLFEDGEFHVALRSALIDGRQARLFAGCGIVGDSDPSSELAETETKLQALLPVLSVS